MNNRHALRSFAFGLLLVGAVVAPAAAAVVNGTPGPDVLTGTASSDTIRGYAGSDTIYGRAGSDAIYAGRGADKVNGGRGADRLFPGNDSRVDVMRGGPGPDRIFARTGRGLAPDGEEAIGRDRVYAGPGNDFVTVLENWGWYMPFIDCGAGHDTVVVPIRMGALTQNCERDVVKAR